MDTRLHRYSIARFSVYVAVLAGTLAVGSSGGWTDMRSSNLLYVSAFSLVVVATATAALRRWRTGSVFLYAQLFVDLAISTILCAFTGRGTSPLLILYFPTIASAAYLRGLRGSLVAAALATAMVVALSVVGRSFSGPDARLVLYYEVMFRVFAFFLIAVLTGQLAESAERTGLELVEARRTSELLASEHQMVLDTVRAGVITVGHDRKIVACNPAARDLLGDVAGRSIREVLPGITNAAATDLAWEEVRPDGQRWICSAAEMATEGSVVVVEDITELERMRERHLRDERLVGIGRIAQSVAHEIRNPLASLSGALQIVAEEHPSRVVNIALSEAARLNRMVEDFLTSAKPPASARR